MNITSHIVYTSIIFLMMLATILLRRKGLVYDYMLLLTALVTGFFITGLFGVQHWYYHLPLFGITVSITLLLLSMILILCGVQSRRLKR